MTTKYAVIMRGKKMSLILPINLNDLLYCSGVESTRVEFKASWDEKTTGYQVLKTICAFANDIQHLNGGYIVIGVGEQDGRAQLPPAGLAADEIDRVQKWIRQNCRRLEPEYFPVFSPEVVDGRQILVLWVPASYTRPHCAPDGAKGDKRYYIRIGSETIDAQSNGMLPQLIALAGKVAFDDRRAFMVDVAHIQLAKVREFLLSINSGLMEENDTKQLYRKMKITFPINNHDEPKNIALLLFSNEPEEWFTGARIEVVQFPLDGSGDRLIENYFRGGLIDHLRQTLSFLESVIVQHYIEKQEYPFNPQSKAWDNYPPLAIREALVNAVYHRSYENTPHPIKVYIYPERMVIASAPGPLPAIQIEHLLLQKPLPPLLDSRNRRIGEFLKELKLVEERGTGLKKIYTAMRNNGSPDPIFEFDEGRTYFQVTLPIHPRCLPPQNAAGGKPCWN
jgi:ATP-dependent DNA helicase RecG